ncbi:MAG: hypothetical protein JWO94_2268 [Verrucomicrobiaceae bacterium]|nr:hypothetical protein [Verrucomicrobiaceae bacterium]
MKTRFPKAQQEKKYQEAAQPRTAYPPYLALFTSPVIELRIKIKLVVFEIGFVHFIPLHIP